MKNDHDDYFPWKKLQKIRMTPYHCFFHGKSQLVRERVASTYRHVTSAFPSARPCICAGSGRCVSSRVSRSDRRLERRHCGTSAGTSLKRMHGSYEGQHIKFENSRRFVRTNFEDILSIRSAAVRVSIAFGSSLRMVPDGQKWIIPTRLNANVRPNIGILNAIRFEKIQEYRVKFETKFNCFKTEVQVEYKLNNKRSVGESKVVETNRKSAKSSRDCKTALQPNKKSRLKIHKT